MLRRFAPLTSIALALPLVACSEPPPEGEQLRMTSQPIVTGGFDGDSGDDAIVAVLSNQTECTGTVIQQSGTTGYVLTAAHCCDPQFSPTFIAVGSDYSHPAAGSGNVTGIHKDSYVIGGAADQPFDFCIVTFTTGKQFQVIPPMTPATDNVTMATNITAYGFGQTAAVPEGQGGDNSLRKSIGPIHVEGFESQYQALYDERNGGTCFGDSGGPDLAIGSDGIRRVYGVHSFVSGTCNDTSGSGIVSKDFDRFINPILTGVAPVEDCQSCAAAAQSGGACNGQVTACQQNQSCIDLINCINGCNGNASCTQTCATNNSAGLPAYNAIVNCICDTACTTECASSCGGSSTSTGMSTGVFMGTAASSTAASTSASSTGVGTAGGATPAGAGGSGAGGGNKDGGTSEDGGCDVGGAGGQGSGFAMAIALAALFSARRRR